VRREVTLARAIVNSKNLDTKENRNFFTVKAFNNRYRTSVAPHWPAIEYGSSQNVRNARGRILRFIDPGSGRLQRASGSSARTGRGFLTEDRSRSVARKRRAQPVRNPILPGEYLDRAYTATIGVQLEKNLRNRLRRLFGSRG
jgi:hypothetical protein